MAVFQSKYRELSFYVNGVKHSFASGSFSTDDEEVIAVLETLTDAVRVDEQSEEIEMKPEDKPKSRKASAK